MEHHVPLSLSLDGKFDSNFADDLISQFDVKRGLLYTLSDTDSGNVSQTVDDNNKNNDSNDDDDIPITTPLVPVSRTVQSEDGNDHGSNLNSDTHSVVTVSSPPARHPQAPQPQSESLSQTQQPEKPSPHAPGVVPPPACLVQPQKEIATSSPYVKTNFLPPPPPPTTANQTRQLNRQNNNGLLRRSSTYLRQKFFSAAQATPSSTTKSHPIPNNTTNQQTPSNTSDDTATEVPVSENITANRIMENDRTANIPIDDNNTSTSPPLPCQYPPKPLSYCPVEPATDDHPRRTSFPTLASWRKKSMQDPRRQSEPTVTPIKGRRPFFF
ncbi:hypothetical protein BCR42DRAFT_415387 [Absidia repens]|uniref:Uncharacterized protein n=1 Tax=Absidia repens TaxID=90262 RepID=A0A1X2IHF6_9FUNG|nr:hypothetical protein BCR42DRAFT_415387 [Absidia repens]